MKNIHLQNPQNIEKIKKTWKKDGVEKFHVITDFDRTLTYAFVQGQQSPTVIAQIRNGEYLNKEYVKTAHALYDKYAPLENDPKLNREEKNAAMREWWKTHFDLLVKNGLTKKLMDEIVANRTLRMRAQTKNFFQKLNKANIPLIIMSAAPEYMLAQYLKQEECLFENIYIIANKMIFDEKENFVGIAEPIIHSLNKYEIIIKDFPIFNKLEDRKNVLLIGDQIDDIGMIEGFPYQTLLKTGFLNERPSEINEEKLEIYLKNYDIVITGDPGFEDINNLLKEIFDI